MTLQNPINAQIKLRLALSRERKKVTVSYNQNKGAVFDKYFLASVAINAGEQELLQHVAEDADNDSLRCEDKAWTPTFATIGDAKRSKATTEVSIIKEAEIETECHKESVTKKEEDDVEKRAATHVHDLKTQTALQEAVKCEHCISSGFAALLNRNKLIVYLPMAKARKAAKREQKKREKTRRRKEFEREITNAQSSDDASTTYGNFAFKPNHDAVYALIDQVASGCVNDHLKTVYQDEISQLTFDSLQKLVDEPAILKRVKETREYEYYREQNFSLALGKAYQGDIASSPRLNEILGLYGKDADHTITVLETFETSTLYDVYFDFKGASLRFGEKSFPISEQTFSTAFRPTPTPAALPSYPGEVRDAPDGDGWRQLDDDELNDILSFGTSFTRDGDMFLIYREAIGRVTIAKFRGQYVYREKELKDLNSELSACVLEAILRQEEPHKVVTPRFFVYLCSRTDSASAKNALNSFLAKHEDAEVIAAALRLIKERRAPGKWDDEVLQMLFKHSGPEDADFLYELAPASTFMSDESVSEMIRQEVAHSKKAVEASLQQTEVGLLERFASTDDARDFVDARFSGNNPEYELLTFSDFEDYEKRMIIREVAANIFTSDLRDKTLVLPFDKDHKDFRNLCNTFFAHSKCNLEYVVGEELNE